MAKEMAGVQKKLNDLKEKAAQAQADLKVKLNNEVGDLQKKSDDLQKKLQDMESATGKAWKDLKSEIDAAVTSLQKDFDEVTSPPKK
jgi:peptidoglycan hydrolase CwlO-like protein